MDQAASRSLNESFAAELLRLGADGSGYGSLAGLPPETRAGLPIGVSVFVTVPPGILAGIRVLPTPAYKASYDRLNARLDEIVARGADWLRGRGYRAEAQTRAKAGRGETENNTLLPHKTVATRAGIGWVGKSALLVTERYGPAVRLSAILTDAPLQTADPVNHSRCGGCMLCAEACPGAAVSGINWAPGIARDEFFDPVRCRETARERSRLGFGGGATLCGKCIVVCPYAQKYINQQE